MRGWQAFNNINNTLKPYLEKPLETYNIEELMNMAYQFPKSVQIRFNNSIYNSIYDLLGKQTECTSDQINNLRSQMDEREESLFRTLLLHPDLIEEDFFITLNYDIILDRELFFIQNSVDYGFPSTTASSQLDVDHHKFSIYHLHGALNWRFSDISSELVITTYAIQPTITRSGCNICLVPPGKKELFPVLKPIWDITEIRLKNADELIIIGCSLNPDDTELIELLKKFKCKNDGKNVKVISIEKPGSALTNYYAKLFGPKYRYYEHGFTLHGPNKGEGAIEFIFS